MTESRATGYEDSAGSEEEQRLRAAKQQRLTELDRLYAEHGTPLEREHWGKFIAVSANGQTLLAPTLYEALRQGSDTFGPGNVIFKIGERVVGTIR